MYTTDDETGWKQSTAFKRAFSINVDIEFVGVWSVFVYLLSDLLAPIMWIPLIGIPLIQWDWYLAGFHSPKSMIISSTSATPCLLTNIVCEWIFPFCLPIFKVYSWSFELVVSNPVHGTVQHPVIRKRVSKSMRCLAVNPTESMTIIPRRHAWDTSNANIQRPKWLLMFKKCGSQAAIVVCIDRLYEMFFLY